jgi:hypothetical protein
LTLVNLREWETRRPEPGTVLYQQSLSDYPAGRQLAEELTKSGRMEIFEVARGLELHATSFVTVFARRIDSYGSSENLRRPPTEPFSLRLRTL